MSDAKVDSVHFPCPFCRSPQVAVVGATRSFRHYQCHDCSEIWTAMASTESRTDDDREMVTASATKAH